MITVGTVALEQAGAKRWLVVETRARLRACLDQAAQLWPTVTVDRPYGPAEALQALQGERYSVILLEPESLLHSVPGGDALAEALR
ncbi:MAG: hypothetical protein ACPGUV_10760, partial [Polyangiales bacterium]